MHNANKGLRLSSLAVLFSGTLLASNFTTAQTCFEQEGRCTAQLGWYAGGEIGSSFSDFDNDDLNQLLSNSAFTITSSDLDDSDTSGGLFFGYQFTPSLAVEMGYRDMGEYASTITGATTDPTAFANFASGLAPESGDGASLGLVVSKPVNDLWKVGARFGLWRWDGDIDSNSSGAATRSVNDSDTDVYFGLETSFQFTQQLQGYVAATRYSFSRDNSDNLTLGIRYFFDSKAPKSASKSAPETAIKAPTPPPSKTPESMSVENKPVTDVPKDSDKDGVYDNRDRCANTPEKHVVDSVGCTMFEAVEYQHQLIIYYANNSDVVERKFFTKIEELVQFSRTNSIKYMQIVGHTSAPGTSDYNEALSVRRAESLATLLVQNYGFSKSQLEIVGKGETDLAVMGSTEAAHAKNRRIEVNLSATGKVPKTK